MFRERYFRRSQRRQFFISLCGVPNCERPQSKLDGGRSCSRAEMRHEAILGVQQALDLPGVVGMKTDLNGGILDAGVRRGGYLMWPNKGDFKFQWSAAPRCNQG